MLGVYVMLSDMSGESDRGSRSQESSGGLRRMIAVLGLAAAFGMTSAWVKGNGGGVRDAIGNISAVWLPPFLAAAAAGARRLTTAALAGLAATLAALCGFYFADSFVLDLGPHPWLTDLALTMHAV